jgi:hypothetical protein
MIFYIIFFRSIFKIYLSKNRRKCNLLRVLYSIHKFKIFYWFFSRLATPLSLSRQVMPMKESMEMLSTQLSQETRYAFYILLLNRYPRYSKSQTCLLVCI